MGAVAVFDPIAWAARYPEFGQVPASVAEAYAAEATLYFANDGTGPVQDPNQQLALLGMVTAHIAQLNATVTSTSIVNGSPVTTTAPASPLVGRISSASEGSVSVSTDLAGLPASAAFWSQTKYGLQFWAATAPYRTFRYAPRPRALYPFDNVRGIYGRSF